MAATGSRLRVALRAMTARDLTEVRRIERAAYPDAWSRRVFEQELRNDFAHYVVAVEHPEEADDDGRGLLAGLRERLRGPRERIIGFAGAWYMVDQLHLVTIAVDPLRQGRGIGQRLLFEVVRLAREAGMGTVVLEVRESNARARALYDRFGFRSVGRLPDYYKDNHETAIVMETPRLDDAAYAERLGRLAAEHRTRRPELWED